MKKVQIGKGRLMIERISTKQLIAQGLKQLLQTNDIQKISVVDIINECRLSKRTFYNHFTDKYQALAYLYDLYAGSFDRQLKGHFTMAADLPLLFSQMQADRQVYQHAFAYEGQNNLLAYVYRLCMDYAKEQLADRYGKRIPEEELFASRFYYRGVIATVKEWVLAGMETAPDELAAALIDCLPERLKGILK